MILKVREIHTYYGRSHILQGVSLEVEKGEIVTLLGRNGAGKSTTLKSILGLVAPRSGEVTFLGERISGRPPHLVCQRGISFVPEERRIIPGLSVYENLRPRGPPARGPHVGPVRTRDIPGRVQPHQHQHGCQGGRHRCEKASLRGILSSPQRRHIYRIIRLRVVDKQEKGYVLDSTRVHRIAEFRLTGR